LEGTTGGLKPFDFAVLLKPTEMHDAIGPGCGLLVGLPSDRHLVGVRPGDARHWPDTLAFWSRIFRGFGIRIGNHLLPTGRRVPIEVLANHLPSIAAGRPAFHGEEVVGSSIIVHGAARPEDDGH